MENITNIFDLMEKGGWVMYALAPLSVYATGIIIYKVWQIAATGASHAKFVDVIIDHLYSGKPADAHNLLVRQKGVIARVMEVAIRSLYFDKLPEDLAKEEITRVGLEELKPYTAHMRGLEMVSNIAPLLGLLGTVSGMVNAFSGIQAAGPKVDPALLAGGIWEALLTTVVGLTIAIPALAAHYMFESKIDKLRLTMRDVATQVIVAKNRD